jgi:hypothetical protein
MSNQVSRVTGVGIAIASGVLVFFATACSASPDVGQSSGSDSNEEVTGAGKKGPQSPDQPATPTTPTTPTPGTEDGGTPTGDLACGAMATELACETCCETNHSAGETVYSDAYDACMCGPQGKCQAACALSDCSDDENSPDVVPGDACDVCQKANAPGDGTGACDAPINTTCNGNADCALLNKCYDSCP